jgi:hypothetical protein
MPDGYFRESSKKMSVSNARSAYICNTEVYRVAQKEVDWLLKYTLNTLDISLLLTEFTKIVRNGILHVQCTTQNAVIPFYKLTGMFKYEHSR